MKSPTIWLFAALWKLRRRVHRWEWRRSGRTLAATTRGCLRAAIGDEYAPESVPVLSGITSFWPDGAPCPYPAPAGQTDRRSFACSVSKFAFSREAGSRVIRMRSCENTVNTVSTVSTVSDSASGADSEQQT